MAVSLGSRKGKKMERRDRKGVPEAKGKPGVECVRVLKRGRAEGLTFIVTNAIEAVVREKVVVKRNKIGKPVENDSSVCSE
ncbi:hypothetical protein PG991_012552 [Apiospora marii]|uniref:Histone H4 n=2 Tax=Apiospora marii TaxID=335849 RepID=A0ABR1RA07_9PEZI